MHSDTLAGDGALPLQVAAIRDEAEAIRSFELRHAAGSRLPPFDTGAHLTLEVELPDGTLAPRQYSLLGDPSDRDCYRIAVLREDAGRGGSRFLHDRISPGSQLRAAAPENGFPLLPGAEHTILIAGGIGITAILGMARALERAGASFELHYVARTPDRMAFRETIATLAGARARFYHSEPPWCRPLVLADVLRAPHAGGQVYVCGPTGLIRAASAAAAQAGWSRRQVHFEGFGPKQRAGDHPITVHLARSGITVNVVAGQTILDALLDAGVWAPYECRRGTCASCMTPVVSGLPDHRDLCLSDALREHHICTCVSRATSDHLTLDL